MGPTDGHRISLPDLPEDIFLLVLAELDIWDVASCQRVSKLWRAAFLNDGHLCIMLKQYPGAREVREVHLTPGASDVNWKKIFRTVATRYDNLTHGTVRKVTRYPLAPCEQTGDWFPVGQWDYHESQPGGRLYYESAATHLSRLGAKPYLFRPTMWSYDDGLLVYAPAEPVDRDHPRHILALLDVRTAVHYPIPFDVSGKFIRNLRLRHCTLVVEWAEKDPFHNLNAMEQVNRHFASCFDVSRQGTTWDTVFRSEWKIHFLGLPPNQHDRFFSTHDATHYAVYFWQPNRSMYTGDEEMPIESLCVWNISTPSSYQPSTDPSGKDRPADNQGPHTVARFSFHAMDSMGVRQHASVSLMSLHVDSASLSLTVRENVCVAGQGYFDPAERLWCAKTTTFPFLGQGPHLRREWDGNLPPYRGHCSMESAELEEIEGWFSPIMDVVDADAHVRLSLVETCFTGQSMDNRMVVRVKTGFLGDWVSLEDSIVREISGMGRIAGDERWVIGQSERQEIVVVEF